MRNNFAIWFSIAALVVCLLTLAFVTVNTISSQRETGYVNRVLEENLEHMAAQESNIELYRSYVEMLRQSLVARGIPAPPLPEIIKVKPIKRLERSRE